MLTSFWVKELSSKIQEKFHFQPNPQIQIQTISEPKTKKVYGRFKYHPQFQLAHSAASICPRRWGHQAILLMPAALGGLRDLHDPKIQQIWPASICKRVTLQLLWPSAKTLTPQVGLIIYFLGCCFAKVVQPHNNLFVN